MSTHQTQKIHKIDNPPEPSTEEREAIKATRELARQIVIQIPYRGGDSREGIHGELVPMIIKWVNAGIMVMPIRDTFGGFLEVFRNYMVDQFLTEGAGRRYLLMLDNDVVPQDPLAPIMLASHDKEVVSGVACGFRPDVGLFACFAAKDETGIARFPSRLETKVMPSHGLRECEVVGTGCVMIRRDVLETIREKEAPFSLPEDVKREALQTGRLPLGEDTAFSYRAARYGFKLWVDFEVQCYHDKMIPLVWGEENLDEDLDPKDWDVTRFAPPVGQR